MTDLHVQDFTLRDGMHAVSHALSVSDVRTIAAALDQAGVAAGIRRRVLQLPPVGDA